MKVLSGVYWDSGQRLHNEDSVALQQVLTCRGRVFLAIVCDGIGGLPHGETASGYVVERFVEHFYRQLIAYIGNGRSWRAVCNSMSRCFYEIGQELNVYGTRRELSLGTTASLLLCWRNRYVIFHIGDSRIYCCTKRGLRQMTQDHSDGKHGLLKCLGSFSVQKPQVKRGRVWANRGFLLCTDGFYRKMSDEVGLWDPTEIYEQEQIEKRLEANAAFVKSQGEKDNLSAVYVKLGRRGWT